MTAVSDGFNGNYSNIGPYYKYRDSLYAAGGVLLYNDRVVVPVSLRQPVLDVLHSAHQGVSGMTQRAKSIMFWPDMSQDIITTRAKCNDRNQNAPSPAPLPGSPATTSLSSMFEQVYGDFFEFAGHDYLVTGDRLSGWPEIFSTPSGTTYAGARGLIACLRKFLPLLESLKRFQAMAVQNL